MDNAIETGIVGLKRAGKQVCKDDQPYTILINAGKSGSATIAVHAVAKTVEVLYIEPKYQPKQVTWIPAHKLRSVEQKVSAIPPQ